MRIVFVLLRPLPRRQQNDEFGELRPDAIVEANVLAKSLQAVHQLRTAEHRNERPLRSSRSTRGDYLFQGFLLRLSHLVLGNRRHSILRRGRAHHEQQNTSLQSKGCESHGQAPPRSYSYGALSAELLRRLKFGVKLRNETLGGFLGIGN